MKNIKSMKEEERKDRKVLKKNKIRQVFLLFYQRYSDVTVLLSITKKEICRINLYCMLKSKIMFSLLKILIIKF